MISILDTRTVVVMENKRVPAVLEALCQFDCVNSSPSIKPATPATQDPPVPAVHSSLSGATCTVN